MYTSKGVDPKRVYIKVCLALLHSPLVVSAQFTEASASICTALFTGLHPLDTLLVVEACVGWHADCLNMGGHSGMRKPAETGNRLQHDPHIFLCPGMFEW